MKGSQPGLSIDAPTLIERQVRHWDNMAAVLKKAAPGKPLAELTQRPVLTISGPVGSGGELLGAALCKELEYTLYDRELLDAVASNLQCQRALLEGLDDRVQSNLRTMIQSLIHGREIENQNYISSLVRIMGSLAEKGGALIVGRGGAFILGARSALRILVDAPLEARVQRLTRQCRLSEADARRFIQQREPEQRKFCHYYFHRDLTDPSGYDLAINTERIEPERAVAIVMAALHARGIEIRKLPRPLPES
jgi:cytidylate kinase